MRLSTVILSVVIVALGLTVIELQRRLVNGDRKVTRLKMSVRRQGKYLRVFATPGKERDEMLRHFEGLKGWFDMQTSSKAGE
jgi:hypothetical protein